MTAQVPDYLMVGGKQHFLFTNPLGSYLERHPPSPPFARHTTANWRGYAALWTIDSDRLYPSDISGWICTRLPEPGSGESSPRHVTLSDLLPDASGPVHAAWNCGTPRVPQGRLVDYVYQGYASQYERFLLVGVAEGVVRARREVRGTPPPGDLRWSLKEALRRIARCMWRRRKRA